MSPRPDVTALLAASWSSLPHEDGHPRRLMHLSQFGQDPDTKARVAILCKDLADSVQTLFERNGYTITHKDDPKPADANGYKQVKLKHHCGIEAKKIAEFGCSDDLTATLGNLAIRSLVTALSSHLDECAGA